MSSLAKRAAACKGWRWMPGMLAQTPEGKRVGRVVERVRTGGVRLAGGGDVGWRCVPDLSDPATVGCLLALVREAWGDPHVYVLSCAPDWFTVCSPNADLDKWIAHPPIDGRNEAEALVAALEAAP